MTETSEEIWFVLLQGEELGPLSFEEVLDFYYKDVISSETLIWRDGLEGWLPIVHVAEFNELLFQGVIIQEVPPSMGEDTAFIDHSALSSAVESAKYQQETALESDISLDDLELEELEPIDLLEDESSTPMNSGYEGPQLRISSAPKKAKSRIVPLLMGIILLLIGGGLFVLKPWENLGTSETSQRSVPQPSEERENSAKQNTPDIGLQLPIQTPEVPSNEVADQGQGQGITQVAIVEEDSTTSAQAMNDIQTLDLPRTEEQLRSDEERDEKSETLKPGIEELTVVEETELEIETTIEIKAPEENKGNLVAKRHATQVRRPAQQKRPSVKPKAPTPPQNTKPKPKTSETVLVTLRRDDLEKVLKKSRSSFQNCLKSDQDLSGTVNVMVVIERSGVVSSAHPTSSKLRKSPANNCVISVVKSLKFPAYSGDMLRVPLPIKL